MMGYDLGGTTSNRTLSSSSTNQKYSVQFSFDNNSAKYSVNGTLISTKSHTRTTNNYPLYIFNTNNFGKIMSEYPSHFKLYDFYLYNSQNIVGAYISAKRKSDNVAGLYDITTSTFKTNSGTGTFNVGPDI